MLCFHPVRLTVTTLVVALWAAYTRLGGLDPEWNPAVRGIVFTSPHRLMVLSAISIGFLFLVAGDLVLMLVGLAAIFTVLHAGLHPSLGPKATYARAAEDLRNEVRKCSWALYVHACS